MRKAKKKSIHRWFAWHPIKYNSPADRRKGWTWWKYVLRSWVEKQSSGDWIHWFDTSEWWYWVYEEDEDIICPWCGWKNGSHLLTCKHWTEEEKRRMRASR